MDLKLNGKIALVTGGNKGIGRAIAARLAEEGSDLMLVARDEAALHEAQRAITQATKRRVETFAVDLATLEGVEATLAAHRHAFGRLDILINNAGVPITGDFFAVPDQAWLDAFALKVFGCVRLCRAFWPLLKKSKGAIVNMAGTKYLVPNHTGLVGGAMNAAVVNFTKGLASLGIQDDVNVNTILPGIIEGELDERNVAAQAKLKGVKPEDIKATRRAQIGVRRFGTPEDVADVVAFLVSPRARHLQGTNTVIDGGAYKGL